MDANNDVNGSRSGHRLPMSEPVESSDLKTLIEALQQQTQAINNLAQSNIALVGALAQMIDDGGDELKPPSYLSGRPA